MTKDAAEFALRPTEAVQCWRTATNTKAGGEKEWLKARTGFRNKARRFPGMVDLAIQVGLTFQACGALLTVCVNAKAHRLVDFEKYNTTHTPIVSKLVT